MADHTNSKQPRTKQQPTGDHGIVEEQQIETVQHSNKVKSSTVAGSSSGIPSILCYFKNLLVSVCALFLLALVALLVLSWVILWRCMAHMLLNLSTLLRNSMGSPAFDVVNIVEPANSVPSTPSLIYSESTSPSPTDQQAGTSKLQPSKSDRAVNHDRKIRQADLTKLKDQSSTSSKKTTTDLHPTETPTDPVLSALITSNQDLSHAINKNDSVSTQSLSDAIDKKDGTSNQTPLHAMDENGGPKKPSEPRVVHKKEVSKPVTKSWAPAAASKPLSELTKTTTAQSVQDVKKSPEQALISKPVEARFKTTAERQSANQTVFLDSLYGSSKPPSAEENNAAVQSFNPQPQHHEWSARGRKPSAEAAVQSNQWNRAAREYRPSPWENEAALQNNKWDRAAQEKIPSALEGEVTAQDGWGSAAREHLRRKSSTQNMSTQAENVKRSQEVVRGRGRARAVDNAATDKSKTSTHLVATAKPFTPKTAHPDKQDGHMAPHLRLTKESTTAVSQPTVGDSVSSHMLDEPADVIDYPVMSSTITHITKE